MAADQKTYIPRKGGDIEANNVDVDGALEVTGTSDFTGAATFAAAPTFQAPPTFDAVAGVQTVGPVVKLTETVAYDDFTDGGAAVGTFDLTVGTIPIGATVIAVAITAVTGFTGDTSAVITIGDGTDADRYNTGTPSIFATAAGGVSVGAISGVAYHAAAATVKLTVTTNADFTSVSAGSLTIEITYVT